MDRAVLYRRRRRLALGGTFLCAIAMAMQMGLEGQIAIDMLGTTLPVVLVGGALAGWFLRPASALALGAAAVALMGALGVTLAASAYKHEMLLFAMPLSAAAAIVVGHIRRWPGWIAGAFAVALAGLSFGVVMSGLPAPFAIVHLAMLVTLPTVPIRGEAPPAPSAS